MKKKQKFLLYCRNSLSVIVYTPDTAHCSRKVHGKKGMALPSEDLAGRLGFRLLAEHLPACTRSQIPCPVLITECRRGNEYMKVFVVDVAIKV